MNKWQEKSRERQGKYCQLLMAVGKPPPPEIRIELGVYNTHFRERGRWAKRLGQLAFDLGIENFNVRAFLTWCGE